MTKRSTRAQLADAVEASVVVLAAAGDDLAFEELVRRRQSSLRGLLRRFCGDAALADDMAQQVFVQAWTRLGTLRAPGAFGGWLKQIAVNTWLAHLRRRPPEFAMAGAEFASSGVAHDPSLAIDLDSLLARLNPDERVAVVLAYAEGLTHPEIAAATGWPLGTAKSHVQRGAARLRDWLEATGEIK
ncbi:MAG: sigma-70 family RNA polymerase sigma factor [Pseudomonadota bacterium]